MTSSRHNGGHAGSCPAGWGGGAEGQGLGGTGGGGIVKRSTEQPHPQPAVRVVPHARGAPRVATTVAGQPRAPQPCQQHEQRRDYAEVEVNEEEEEGAHVEEEEEGREEVERREEPHPPRTVRFVPVALAAPREAATSQSQPRAHQPRQLLQHEQQHGSSYHEEVEVKEEGCSDDDAEAEEMEAMQKEGRQREQHAQALGASSEGREVEAGADVVAAAFRGAWRPPGSYADTAAVGGDYDDEYVEEEEEEVGQEEEGEENEGKCNSVNGGASSREADDRRSSQVVGVSWNKKFGKWVAKHNVAGQQIHLGYHATAEAAALAIDRYVNDGVDPVQHRGARTSEFKGAHLDKRSGKWRAMCKRKSLGAYATEEAAARAYIVYVEDGVDPVHHRNGFSQFKGVWFSKSNRKWRARLKNKGLGYHATEEGAVRAYNKEAERIGCVDLNVIPPTGDADDSSNSNTAAAAAASLVLASPAAPARADAGAGSKRAAPTTPAPPQAKMTRLGTSASAADVRAATAAAVHSAALQARVNGEIEEEDSYEEAEEAEAGEDDEQAEGRREQHAQALGASHDRRLEAGSGASGGSKRAALSPPPAPPQAKTKRLDTSAAAATAGPRVATALAPANAAVREAAWVARIKAEKAKTEVAEAKTEVAEAQVQIAEARAMAERALAGSEKAKAALAEKQLAAHVAEWDAAEAERKAASVA